MEQVGPPEEQFGLLERWSRAVRAFATYALLKEPCVVDYRDISMERAEEPIGLPLSEYHETYIYEVFAHNGLRAQFDKTPSDFDHVRLKTIPEHLDDLPGLLARVMTFEQFATSTQGIKNCPVTADGGYVEPRDDELYPSETVYIPTPLADTYSAFAEGLRQYATIAQQVACGEAPVSRLEHAAMGVCAVVNPVAWSSETDKSVPDLGAVDGSLRSLVIDDYLRAYYGYS